MKKNIVNKIIVGVAALFATLNIHAASVSLSLTAGTMTNFALLLSNAPVKVTAITLTSATTNVVNNIQFVDTPTNTLVYTNLAYSNLLSYATNYVSTWTNYYGRTNSITNLSLVDVTNSVAGATNNYPVRFIGSVPTNSTVTAQPLSAFFQNGLWVTNGGSGTAGITIQYQQ